MEYDLQIVVPVSSKYYGRIQDFKKYGLCNVKNRKVLLEVLTHNEKIEGLEGGWSSEIDVKNIEGRSSEDFISNLYAHFLDIDVRARWIVKIDDDSCTDVDGLVSNLDKFYDHEQRYYLGAGLERFIMGKELQYANLYRKFFGDIFLKFKHEVEFCAISSCAMKSILNSENSKKFLKERCQSGGGATDVALAYAAILDKVHPVDFPFATQFPLVSQFSIFNGHLNHIHMISKERAGENFCDHERCGKIQHEALMRALERKNNELESKVAGKKFLMETSNEIKLYEFKENRTAKIKFDDRNYVWTEFDGKICVFCEPREIFLRLSLGNSGELLGKDHDDNELILSPLN